MEAAELFLAHARHHGDSSWQLHRFTHADTLKEDVYLVKTELKRHSGNPNGEASINDTQFQELEDSSIGRATVVDTSFKEPVLSYHYHMLWSRTFGAPVLYFNVYSSAGSLLDAEQIYQLIPDRYRSSVGDRSAFFTQADHPYLNIPFFYIHPCQAAKLPAAAGLTPSCDGVVFGLRELLLWLSVHGPVIGLEYSPEWHVLKS